MLERIRLQHARRRSADPQRLARSVQHRAAAQGLRLDDARGVCTLLRDYSIYENPPLILGGMMGISSRRARHPMFASLAGCGGSQPPSGAPGAMPQAGRSPGTPSALWLTRNRYAGVSMVCV